MPKPVILTINAVWAAEAGVWSGRCDDIPAAADATNLDVLLDKMWAITLDLLPDNHPGLAAADVYLQIMALQAAPDGVAA